LGNGLNLTDADEPKTLSIVARPKSPRGAGGKMTNVRLSVEELDEIVRAIKTQYGSDALGIVANPAAFLRDAGLREARRILAAKGKK
jgi:hypothetical protein